MNKIRTAWANGVFRWITGALAIALLTGILYAGWAVRETDRRMREECLQQVRHASLVFSVDDIRSLSGNGADLESPAYQQLKSKLAALRSAFPKCRGLYLFGSRSNGEVFCYGSSVRAGFGEDATPGQIYGNRPDVRQVLETKKSQVAGPVGDPWGGRFSAYVGLAERDTAHLVAVLGMDISASDWWQESSRATLIPMVLTFILVLIILGGGAVLLRSVQRGGKPLSGHIETIMVAAAGVVVTLAAVWVVREHAEHGYRESFTQLANSEGDFLANELRTLINVELEGVARFFEGSDEVTPQEFDTYTTNLDRNHLVDSWEWIPVVPVGEKTRFEKAMRALGIDGYTIITADASVTTPPVPARDVYYPITYMNPRNCAGRNLGQDLGDKVPLRVAFDRARLALTGPFSEPETVSSQGESCGVLITAYCPVYTPSPRQVLRGFVSIRLNSMAFLEHTFETMQNQDGAAMSCDLRQLSATGRPRLMAAVPAGNRNPSDCSVTRFLSACGVIYSVEMQPEPAFDALHRSHAVLGTLLAGLMLTAAFTVWIGGVVQRRRNLERLVEARTALLTESEESLRRMFQGNPVPMALVTMGDLSFADVNDAFLEMSGYLLADVIGKRGSQMGLYAHPEQEAGITEHVMRARRITNLEQQFRRKDGRIVDGLLSGEVIVSHGREYFLIVVVDITDRKRAETERMRLATAIEQAGETIVVTDAMGIIQYTNPAFSAISGYSCEEAIGKNPSILKSGAHDEVFYKDLWTTVLSGKTWRGRVTNKRKDGTLYLEDSVISPVRDETGTIVNFVAVKRDITNEIKLEKQLLQSQKMESVGRLAGGVAHDFNNMLGIVLGYTDIAMEKAEAHQPVLEELKEIKGSAQRAAELTRQLLAFARKQTVAPKVLDFNQTVESMLKMLPRLIGENIELVWRPGSSLWPVKMDPSQIDQVLTNLCINARDAINGVGRITIETRNTILDDGWCQSHEGAVPGEYVEMTLMDNGVGMSPEVLAHIFEPFFTTKGLGKGSGLGLATVYGIIKQNRGFITVSSQPGIGTTILVYLPRSVEKTVELSAKPVDSPAKGGCETILLVEDEPAILLLNKKVMERLGYRVLAASQPAEAIRMSQEYQGDIHLLMTDVVMPGMDGWELSRKVLERRPAIKRLFVSGYPANVIVKDGVLDEGLNFIQKPFTVKALADVLRTVFDSV